MIYAQGTCRLCFKAPIHLKLYPPHPELDRKSALCAFWVTENGQLHVQFGGVLGQVDLESVGISSRLCIGFGLGGLISGRLALRRHYRID